MGSGGRTSTTVQQADPWRGVQPYLTRGLGEAEQRFNTGQLRMNPYEGNRVGGFGPASQQGMNAIMATAGQGAPGVTAANAAIGDMVGGENVYRDLDTVRNEALGRAIPAATAMFSGSGMTNSGMAMDTVGRAATEAIAPIEYGAWNAAQDRRLQGAALAPQLEAARYMPGQMMQAVGGQQDAMNQARIDADMQRWYETQGAAGDELQRYANLLLGYGGQGGSQTTTGPSGQPGLMGQIGGGAMTGLGTYGMLAGAGVANPWAIPLAGAAGLFGAFR